MTSLTARQSAVLACIRDSIQDRGYPPTMREIAEHIGTTSTNGIADHLKALQRKGYLTRNTLQARGIRLTRAANDTKEENGMSVEVKVCLLHPDAKMPTYAKAGDSGMDLATPVDIVLSPGYPAFIDLGIAVAIPEGYEGQIRSRSGLTKKGLTACSGLGTIDSGYRGSLGVTLLWHSSPMNGPSDTWGFAAGERIAQLVIAPVVRAKLLSVKTQAELGDTERGVYGFGSSGL